MPKVQRNRAEIVVAGHICLDIILTFGESGSPWEEILVPGKLINVGAAVATTGGAVSNTGRALHRLGVPTRLVGKVGNDLFGHAVLEILRKDAPALAEGMLIAQDSPTSYTVVINPPGLDRIFLHYSGANEAFGAADVPYDRLDGVKLFHFGYPPLLRRMFSNDGAELVSLLRGVKAAGVTTSLDMAKPDPTSEAGKAPWLEILTRALPYVDVFLPSFDEILFMLDRNRFDRMGPAMASGVDGPLLRELADRLLAMGAAIVGLKLGPEGLYLRTTAESRRLEAMGSCTVNSTEAWLGRELLAPCFLADVSGTTGAGDCTIAGFLAGLAAGLGPEDTMKSAVAVGACSVEKADATSGIPTWERLRARMAGEWKRRPVSLDLTGWRWDEDLSLWHGPDDPG